MRRSCAHGFVAVYLVLIASVAMTSCSSGQDEAIGEDQSPGNRERTAKHSSDNG